ncbi:MAG: TonB-dependent receptor [Candidatus Scalindua sp.]|nr:TonB-dependent receptor [Candidatus Scalindua sp.]
MRSIHGGFAAFAAVLFNVSCLFSEETSVGSGITLPAIQEEIRWLQAESFLSEVTTLSRKPVKLSDSAAATFVITQEGIRRSGATTIPELLRMVPGLEVSRIDASKWAITSRGFNGRFSSKLLVLIDGRSVYTPLFSGVYWDIQNYLLEDLERIEVIRGPGGTLWGANAVNGIINIITKNSKDTRGGLIKQWIGTKERNVSGIRYGGNLGKDAYYRCYARYFNHDDSGDVVNADDSVESNDKWDILHGGFRTDWDVSDANSLTLQGDMYNGDINELSRSFERRGEDVSGGNILGLWQHIFSDTSDMKLKMYFDRTYRKTDAQRETRHTFDIDFQHKFCSGSRQEIVWGIGYQLTTDDIKGFTTLMYDPSREGLSTYSAFVQNEITLIPDKLQLTLGTKLMYNDFTEFEIQPSARLLWRPFENHTLWGAVSRAVRTPSRFDRDSVQNVDIPFSPVRIEVSGSNDFVSENVHAYELGYRFQPSKHFFVDIASYYSAYNDLLTSETGDPVFRFSPPPFKIIIPSVHDNKMDGEVYGLEVSANWTVTDYWRLTAGYTLIRTQLDLDKTSTDTGAVKFGEGLSPRNQVQFLSYLDLPYNLEFDSFLYYVDHVASLDIPSYVRLDVRLGWRPTKSMDLSIGGKNLLDDKHPENPRAIGVSATEVERSVFGSISWRF